jgi:hypothetical protein
MTPTLDMVAPLNRLVRARRGRGLAPLEILPDGFGSAVLVVPGELLVRSSDLGSASVKRLVAEHRLKADLLPGLGGRVARLSGRALDDHLPEIVDEARGLPVAAHHVAALAGYIKALGDPVPVAAGRPFQPAAPAGCVVAVLDTGVDARPRTDGWLAGLADVANIEPEAGTGHGTFVAGIVQQIAPAAGLRAYRVLDADGVGSDARVAATMLRAAEDGADVLSLSLGTRTVNDEPPIAFEAALGLLAERHPESLVVAAAGNDGEDRPCWPAAFEDVAAVAGLDADAEPSGWSNHGEWVTCSAVAEGIVSTFVADSPWASWTGTSFAAPQVAAAVANGCAEHGVSPRAALAALLGSRPVDPAYGAALEILPGT